MEDLANGTLPRAMLLSMISLSARFSDDTYFQHIDPRVRGRPYAAEAEKLLDLRDVSVSTIQTCVLLGAFVITESEAASEALYYGIACRLAMILDLPNKVVSSRIEQEINIRVWWSLSMIDVWSSNGLRIPRALAPGGNIALPMEETVFLGLRREIDHGPLHVKAKESAASLLTQMVKLNAILVEVSQMNAAAAATGSYSVEFDATVDSLGAKLDAWYDSLPVRVRDTPENLSHYASLGLGGMFVAVYLGYYHYGQLLYYQYLHENSCTAMGSSPHISTSTNVSSGYYASKCKSHSTALCEILYRSYDTPGAEVYYNMVGHVLVIASTVQLHMLLFSNESSSSSSLEDDQRQAARHRLERNFEILTHLQTFWPTLDVSFSRFVEFHKACQKSHEATFRMDRWMLQFMFAFSKPVREKTAENEPKDLSLGGGNSDSDSHDVGNASRADLETLSTLKPWSMADLGI